MNSHHSPRGFVALISAIIISTVLLGLATTLGSSTFFSRFDVLNGEYKRISLGLAEACVTQALNKIANNYAYTVGSDPAYDGARGGVVIALGSVYGKTVDCVITGPTTYVAGGTGKRVFAIAARAAFFGAYSNVTAQATAQDPASAPVIPPPYCSLQAFPTSISLGQPVTLQWASSGSPSSFSIVSSQGPTYSGLAFNSPPNQVDTPTSVGTVTYTGTISNAGGSNPCTATVAVNPAPPAPSCADTVMILDRTGSMSSYLTEERNAADALRTNYQNFVPVPQLGVGSFGAYPNASLPAGAASVPANGTIGNSYGTIGSLIANMMGGTSSVGSNLGAAINAAATALSGSTKVKVLIFVTDGDPSEPTSSSADTGFLAPTANAQNGTGDAWTNPGNAYNTGDTTDNAGHRHRYSNFGFSVPTGVTISGIDVQTTAWTTTSGGPVTLVTDGFGTGATDSTFNEAPVWTEGGNGAEKRASGSGNDSPSSDGGRFATVFDNGWICMPVNAANVSALQLSYLWRGDQDANSSSDTGIVEYRTASGNCSSSSGWNTLQTHDLRNDTTWSTQSAFALPSSLNNTTFYLRFRGNGDTNEYFRVDKVLLSGSNTVSCTLGVDLSWNGGTNWSSEDTQVPTGSPAPYTLNGPWTGHTWVPGDFSNTNFRARIHASTSGPTCHVDTLTARVTYTIPSDPIQYATNAAVTAKAAGVNIFSVNFGNPAGQNLLGTIASPSIVAPSSISTISRTGSTVTVVTTDVNHLATSERVQVSGVANTAFNGTFTITSIVNATTFKYTQSGGTAASSGGLVSPTNLFIGPSASSMAGIFQSIGYQMCPATAKQCANTRDDDGDSLPDDLDPGCHTDGNANNPASYDATDDLEYTVPVLPPPPPPPPPPPNVTVGGWQEVP